MLTILRKYKENLFIKVLLGFIALAFIIFFGSSNPKQNYSTPHSVANVNGKNINGIKANFLLNNQMEQMRSAFNDKIPENFVESMRGSITNSLINQELINQEFQKIGLKTTASELVETIKKNQQFYRDDKFDLEYYNERFLPGYQLATGTSFEKELMDEMVTQNFFDTFNNLLELSPPEAEKIVQIENAKFKFTVIKIQKDNQASAHAQKIFDVWKKGGNIDSLLTEQKLQKTETAELGYVELKSIFGGKVSADNAKKLLSLSLKNPFPEQMIEEGNQLYLIKFLEIKSPKKPDETSLAKIKEDFTKDMSESLKSSFISELKNSAKIKVYP